MARNRTVQNIIEYAIFLPISGTLRILPRMAALRLGGALGWLGMYLLPKRRQLVLENLSLAFPEKDSTEIDQICRKTFRHIGISVAEMNRIDKFKGKEDLEKYFIFEGLEHLNKAKADQRGALLLSAHIGFWEVGAFFFPELDFPAGFVAKKAKNPYINNYMLKMREHRSGSQVIDAKNGARQIVKTLNEGKFVGVLIDHHMHENEAVQVPFFGRPAWTTPIITQIAMKRDIPVIPTFVYRTEDFRYRAVFAEPFYLKGELKGENITANTALLTRIIEDAIRQEPSQWFWVHKRWR